MIHHIDCRECCRNQVRKLAILLKTSPEAIMKSLENDYINGVKKSAPEYAEIIFHEFKEQTGVKDPYSEIKKSSNIEAEKIFPTIEKELSEKLDGLAKVIELAIVGNIIDYGAFSHVDVHEFIKKTLSSPYFCFDIKELEEDLKLSKSILYIADNAGEIIFDRALIKHLISLGKDVTVAVREKPVINDVTFEDAEFAGLDKLCKVISTGSGIPGIILEKCSKTFVDTYNSVDLVISKGQGNFETLCCIEQPKPKKLYYLFVVKCQVVADYLKANVMDKVLKKS